MTDFSTERTAMIDAAIQAGEKLREYFHLASGAATQQERDALLGSKTKSADYEEYGYEDALTDGDTASEAIIIPILKKCRDIMVVSEETFPNCPDVPDGTQRWLIDPIDGTSRFKNGKDDFSITIALQTKKNGQWETDIGLVSEPMKHRMHLADHDWAQTIYETGDNRGLFHKAQEVPAFSSTANETLRNKKIEVVVYSKANNNKNPMMKSRQILLDKLNAIGAKPQCTFSTAMVMATMATPEGADAAILTSNAFDYDWDIHAGKHIAEKSGIFMESYRIHGEPVLLLARSRNLLTALKHTFAQCYGRANAKQDRTI